MVIEFDCSGTLKTVAEQLKARPEWRPKLPDNALDIGPLKFNCTCESSPEQYEVFYEGLPVAYVRLRFSNLTVECPGCGGSYVYEETIDGGGFTGSFQDLERPRYLDECAQAIMLWIETNTGSKESLAKTIASNPDIMTKLQIRLESETPEDWNDE